ncbi:MAG: peptidylprolyl isomerase [Pseudomonadota bacterium]
MIRSTARAALTALALAAFGGPLSAQTTETTEAEPDVPVEEAPAVLETYDADTVVVTVDGIDVTLGQLIAMRQGVPEQYQTLPGEVLMQALSEQLTTQILLAEAGRAAGLAEREDIRLAIETQTMAILADAYLRDQISQRVDEAKVQAEYEARYVNVEQPEEVRAGHILVETLEQAEALKAELDGGADFAVLAAEHGTDGTAQRGGDLGWFIHSDMVPAFADAAFELQPGEVSGPVESPFGYHLIKMEDRRPREAPPLEQVGGEIIQELTTAAQAEVVEGVVAGAEIVPADPSVPPDAIREDQLLLE